MKHEPFKFFSIDGYLRYVGDFLLPVFSSHQKWHFPILLTCVACAFWYYRRRKAAAGSDTANGFFKFLLPKQIYTSQSGKLDFKFHLANIFIVAIFMPPLIRAQNFWARWAGSKLKILELEIEPSYFFLASIAAGIFFFVTWEFGYFVYHRWAHLSPFLWRFHKIHHSCQVLHPLSTWRLHPVDWVLNLGFAAGAKAVGVLIVFAILPSRLAWSVTGSGVAIFFLMRTLLSFNALLRHSHLFIRYPVSVSHLVSSPAMHQLHHSTEDRHLGKNYGYYLSVFDLIFSSLYIPRTHEEFRIGLLDEAEEKRLNRSVFDLMRGPFQRTDERHS